MLSPKGTIVKTGLVPGQWGCHGHTHAPRRRKGVLDCRFAIRFCRPRATWRPSQSRRKQRFAWRAERLGRVG
ncbi:protein of unknown function [Burkholderia multivorans]